ncbi:related to YLF2 - putative glycogen phosphorylase, GTP-binding protein [Melanopsichium pennsylvanicum]|uniref:Obg-like ATPase 1 n=2 Tax=Melanopsichium pennsylvanicum TaxID=63383 RepID=A0AAJ4XTK9_9BASI|nr:related to YLF2-putative glycogen phosphorylase, GTP-binding protein [Melanopsichium pennsylvanicum 4]SNX87747.1 related to YLF2 - putative glycogen phosphorylase, GTP-binding protein [Melanopsichium pennsylvanicum]
MAHLVLATATSIVTTLNPRFAIYTRTSASLFHCIPTSCPLSRVATPAKVSLRPFSTTLFTRAKSYRVNKMPPKKQVVVEKIRLGRPSNNLKMGIVGMPNVGKSSLFNVMTKCDLGKAANFPYATIEPEESRVPVPDDRFNWLCQQYKPKSEVAAFLTCIDIAGLTAGASTGAGLGNAFLSNVRNVDGIFQVVRAFDDAEVIHVEGDVNPIRDMEIISTELRLKDIEWIEKGLDNAKKIARSAGNVSLDDKKKKEEVNIIERLLKHVQEDNKDIRKGDWNNNEVEVINNLQLLTAKPVIYLVNLSERDYVRRKNKWLAKIKQWIDENNAGDLLIPFSVALEERLLQLGSPEAEAAELATLGDNITGALGKITKAGYDGLDLVRYFTAGPDEVRAWTFRKGLKAPEAAGIIHTDFQKKFVCGEVFGIQDIKEHGSENGVKAAGKYKQVGREYKVQDGDICYWKHG